MTFSLYNPEASRSLLIKAGYGPGIKFEYLYPAMPEFKPVAEILQQQWRKNLSVELALRSQEVQAWNQTVLKTSPTTEWRLGLTSADWKI